MPGASPRESGAIVDPASLYIVIAYIVMAHIVMAYIVMAHIVMAHIVMAYIVMAVVRHQTRTPAYPVPTPHSTERDSCRLSPVRHPIPNRRGHNQLPFEIGLDNDIAMGLETTTSSLGPLEA